MLPLRLRPQQEPPLGRIQLQPVGLEPLADLCEVLALLLVLTLELLPGLLDIRHHFAAAAMPGI